MAVAHYLEALAWQRDVATLHAIFGGKNPHPNFVVGGAPSPIDLESDSAINAKRLCAGAGHHRAHAAVRRPGLPARHARHRRLLQGLGHAGRGPRQLPLLRRLPGQVDLRHRELHGAARRDPRPRPVAHRAGGPARPGADPGVREPRLVRLRGRQGAGACTRTTARPSSTTPGPKPPYTQLDVEQGYSWLKSPRWRGKAMEVGPLARMLMLVRDRATRRPRSWSTARSRRWTCRSRRCTRRWAAPRRARSRPRSSPSHAGLVRPADGQHQGGRHADLQRRAWEPAPGRRRRAARASWRRRAARSATGSSSSTARSPTTRRWCRAPGMPARATRPARPAPTRRRWPGTAARPAAAARDPAHHPQLRPVHRLRGARCRARRAARQRTRKVDFATTMNDQESEGARQVRAGAPAGGDAAGAQATRTQRPQGERPARRDGQHLAADDPVPAGRRREIGERAAANDRPEPVGAVAAPRRIAGARQLVRTRRDGQSIYYSLASGQAASIINTLHEQFCGRTLSVTPPRAWRASRCRDGPMSIARPKPADQQSLPELEPVQREVAQPERDAAVGETRQVEFAARPSIPRLRARAGARRTRTTRA